MAQKKNGASQQLTHNEKKADKKIIGFEATEALDLRLKKAALRLNLNKSQVIRDFVEAGLRELNKR